MLTDIFARRYENRPLFNTVGPREGALFVQAYRIINEQLFPYYWDDKTNKPSPPQGAGYFNLRFGSILSQQAAGN